MEISGYIANVIDRFTIDHVFTYADFNMEVDNKELIVKALNGMVADGKITKLSKGKKFKPKQTSFGKLKPAEYQIIKDILEK